MKRSAMWWVYLVSFAAHATLGSAVASIEPTKEQEPIRVRVIEAPPPKAEEPPPEVEPPPPEPPPPVPEAPQPKRAKPEAAPPPEAAAPAPQAPIPTLGVAMSGGVGMGGTAVPVGDARAPSTPAPTKRVSESRALATPAARAPKDDGCDEPAGKPRPLNVPRPEYTPDARAAGIEGKVRLEITVDENGVITNVRVIDSLDAGLDAAAMAAIRGASFEAATRCGKAVSSTFNLAVRFAL